MRNADRSLWLLGLLFLLAALVIVASRAHGARGPAAASIVRLDAGWVLQPAAIEQQ